MYLREDEEEKVNMAKVIYVKYCSIENTLDKQDLFALLEYQVNIEKTQ